MALETHDLVHLQDVIDYLDDCFAEIWDEESNTVGETRFYDYFKDLKDRMQSYYHDVNTNLVHLMNVIEEFLIRKGNLSRGIVFVKTRAIAEALVSWLNRCSSESIRNLNASIFTGTNAKESEGGMSQSQQTALVEKFKNGRVKLLVATSVAEEGLDVPECNLVIKYNHVGNEITTIQTRGRSRKKGGYSILLAMPTICDKEVINRKKTQLMHEGIKVVKKMTEEDFRKNVLQVQENDSKQREVEEMIDANNKHIWKDKKFKLFCIHCRKFCIQSEDIRIVCKNFRIIVNRDVWIEKEIDPTKPQYIDETKMMGNVSCMSEVEDGLKCNGHLGKVVFYNKIFFLAIAIKNFILEEEGVPEPKTSHVKKWKDVCYPIEDLTIEDIKKYLRKPVETSAKMEVEMTDVADTPTVTFAGTQETMPAAPIHIPSISVSGSNSFTSSILSNETNEIFKRWRRQGNSQDEDSALSSYSSSSLHHQTLRKEVV